MTAPLHAAIPATVAFWLTGDPRMAWLAGLLGVVPDAINNKYYTLMPNIKRLYNKLHRPWLWIRGLKLWLVIATYILLFPIGLHVLMDYRYHNNDDGLEHFYEMVLVEAFCWVLLAKIWWL